MSDVAVQRFLNGRMSVVDGMGKMCMEVVTADFMVLVIG